MGEKNPQRLGLELERAQEMDGTRVLDIYTALFPGHSDWSLPDFQVVPGQTHCYIFDCFVHLVIL